MIVQMIKRAIFIGRFSPFHIGHLSIMQDKIRKGIPLLILIRNTEEVMFPPYVRKKMIAEVMKELNVDAKIMIIDDIESVNYGRMVGYEVNEIDVPEDIHEISGSEIRELINKGDNSWIKYIPKGAENIITEYFDNNRKTSYLINKNLTKESDNKVIWFTGLPSSGKSTLAKILGKKLLNMGITHTLLDADVLRMGLNSDLGYSKRNRDENVRRVGELSKLLYDQGNFVIVSIISPYKSEREKIRHKIGDDFIEIYVKCPLEVCEKRDSKGLYTLAREGKINEFTGISDPYEEPENPQIILNTAELSIDTCMNKIIKYLML
jgi:adenylylsulfate kinase